MGEEGGKREREMRCSFLACTEFPFSDSLSTETLRRDTSPQSHEDLVGTRMPGRPGKEQEVCTPSLTGQLFTETLGCDIRNHTLRCLANLRELSCKVIITLGTDTLATEW